MLDDIVKCPCTADGCRCVPGLCAVVAKAVRPSDALADATAYNPKDYSVNKALLQGEIYATTILPLAILLALYADI